MVKVLVYAYATGVFSSRKIARKPSLYKPEPIRSKEWPQHPH